LLYLAGRHLERLSQPANRHWFISDEQKTLNQGLLVDGPTVVAYALGVRSAWQIS
jgi:hypothetical protein